ncbi:hypothetical protein [Streptosporangium sp. NPDC051022]|uniref:hypothetical protein n=1 Tax=Streptosporangium sp. NPDC051022 TaxID=3155752 RepID=UPI0034313C4F
MSRRVVALATATLACLGALAVSAAPAQAAPAQATRSLGTLEIVYSPLSLGEYCVAKVNSSSTVGFYEYGSVACYRWGSNGNIVRAGSGTPQSACTYFHPTYTYVGYAEGGSKALICKFSV